jgi:2-polyprenyl-3-methyl-5-hydroxy-6-metoxy-1,4-benzoquinol methylase
MRLLDPMHLSLARARMRGQLHRSPGERFATRAPSPQSAIDAVPVAWASRLPLAGVSAGDVDLFDDARASWAIDALGGVAGARCLELGPLEGGHSYMLERAGAESVLAVEANKDAFLKCLVTKELLGLRRCSFLCGDAVEYLKATDERFDVCWCAGILYHMVEPVQLIELVSRRASRLYVWTHYYDPDKLPDQRRGDPFANGHVNEAVHGGFGHRLHRHEYGAATSLRAFWGGTRPHSNWMTLQDILGALEHFGWRDVRYELEQHPPGPAVRLVATC